MAGTGTVKLHSFPLEIFPASIMDSWAGTRLIGLWGVCLTYLQERTISRLLRSSISMQTMVIQMKALSSLH